MERQGTGMYVPVSTVGESVRAFVPEPLPPQPPLEVTDALQQAFNRAFLTLGRLDSAAAFLPDTGLFLYQYIRKEAVLSSQIEGTRSSLSDLMLFEIDGAPGAPLDDVREVSHCVAALEHGIRRFKEGFPLCLRLIKELHGILLEKGRGSDRTPGEFRRSQNWIGGTRPGNAVYVPPPPDYVVACMGKLEVFLHDPEQSNPLVKAALAHAQFETIHPFLDGNGRLGRLLITLVLVYERLLTEPLLYLSLFFKRHREEYYALLQRTRTHGDWEAWLRFFLEAVAVTADQGVATARRLHHMAGEDREKIEGLGRLAGSALRIHNALLAKPISTVSVLSGQTGLVPNTVTASLKALSELGIVHEMTGRRRDRVYLYDQCVQIMSQETPEGDFRP
jgi:Fic family protein